MRNAVSGLLRTASGGLSRLAGPKAVSGFAVVLGMLGITSVASATPTPGTDAVYEFGVDFDVIINAVITRVTEYVVPLLLLALGLVAVGVFFSWMRRSSHA